MVSFSMETSQNVVPSERQTVVYVCPQEHRIELPFSIEADIPATWECRCGGEALLLDGKAPDRKAGANGYILKSTTGARLVDAIRTVARGGTAIDPELAAEALRSGPCPLTDREIDILRLVGAGTSTEDIAASLYLSRGTVRNYLSNAMVKLDAQTRAEAFAKAERRGWL